MATYPDIEGHLFEADIEALYRRGLVGVTPGDDYRPDDPITRGESAAYFNRVLNLLGHEAPPVEPPVEPEPEPEPEPPTPPEGMFIPVLQGPKLMHDGNPTVMSG